MIIYLNAALDDLPNYILENLTQLNTKVKTNLDHHSIDPHSVFISIYQGCYHSHSE